MLRQAAALPDDKDRGSDALRFFVRRPTAFCFSSALLLKGAKLARPPAERQ